VLLKLFIVRASFLHGRDVNKYSLRNVAFLACASLALAFATYALNVWLLSLQENAQLNLLVWGPAGASFFEGVFFFLFGALLLIGSGGISRNTQTAAMLASAANAMGQDAIGPSETYRRDAWKPKGSVRFGLTLIIAGIVLLVIYFVSI
jgi:hypothetical protein